MKKVTNIYRILALLFFLSVAGQNAWAGNTWSISKSTSGTTTTFTISRSGDVSISETVRYKTMSVSALDGVHFTGKEGTLTFGAGDAQKTVTITEKPKDEIPLAYRYSNVSSYEFEGHHYYGFEVDDVGGNMLASVYRAVDCDLDMDPSRLFSEQGALNQHGWISDQGYGSNSHWSVSPGDLYSKDNWIDYLKFINAELRLRIEFDAVEEIDGWEYVQVLINNTSDYDSGAEDGNPGTIDKARYMAGFSILGDGEGWSETASERKYKHYTFPHPDYGNDCGKKEGAFGDNWSTWGDLMQQYFNPAACRSSDGKIIIPTNFESITVRFDASGYDKDWWHLKNLYVKVKAEDSTRPTIDGGKAGIRVSGGRHTKGNTIYIAIPFTEMVKVGATFSTALTLKTSWGDFHPSCSNTFPTNVLSFAGTISSDATGNFNILGTEGASIVDMAGNTFEDVFSTYGAFDVSLDEDYSYSISYDLAGGSVATDNPTSYKFDTPSFTLTNPTRTGYFFDGWTGSNGTVPQTTVTIVNTTGDLHFTANWTDVWGMAGGADGSEQNPYTITTAKGLELLAAVVNGLYENVASDCSGKFFVLDRDIAYTYTNAWDDIGNNENNIIRIVDNEHTFLGTFDGRNHTISGIRLYAGGDSDADDYYGLFSTVGNGGVVKRVNLADARITGRNHVGALVGKNAGSLENCTVGVDVAVHNLVSGSENHGGITGWNAGTLMNCVSQAIVTSRAVSSNYGAIAGMNSGTLMGCLAIGSRVFDATSPGAIVGYNNGGVLQHNYYNDCSVGASTAGIGTGSGDIAAEDGAVRLFHITQGEGITISGTASASFAGTDFFKAGTVITLGCNPPSGFIFQDYSVAKDGTNQAVAVINDGGVYRFTMPSNNVTVEAVMEATSWSGNGSKTDPYIILYRSQLELLSNNVNNLSSSYLGKYFELGADIAFDPDDLDANGENFAPIGRNGNHFFGGVFDGAGHTISGIRINKTGNDVNADGCLGLFGYIYGGTVKNLTLTDASITGFSEVGGIVGHMEGSSAVSNCHVTSSVSLHAVKNSARQLGGIVGNHLEGPIEGCTSSVRISQADGLTHCMSFGGIAGHTNGLISNCLVVHATIAYLNRDGDDEYSGAIAGVYTIGEQLTFSHNYYHDVVIRGTSNLGVGRANRWFVLEDIPDNDGAHNATAYTSKPAPIGGSETESYPYGGVTVFARGLCYQGTYYLAGGLEGAAVSLNLVEGTKGGVTAWWGTYYNSTGNYSLSEGAAAYTMDSNYNLYLLGNDGSIIPKGVAVVIVATSSGASYAPAGDTDLNIADHAPGGNILLGSDDTVAVTNGKVTIGTEQKTPHVLSNVNGIGFYPFTDAFSGVIPAHRAFYVK